MYIIEDYLAPPLPLVSSPPLDLILMKGIQQTLVGMGSESFSSCAPVINVKAVKQELTRIAEKVIEWVYKFFIESCKFFGLENSI